MLLKLVDQLRQTDLDSLLGLARDLGYRVTILDSDRGLVSLDRVRPIDEAELATHPTRFSDHGAVKAILDRGDSLELWANGPGRVPTLVTAGEARFGDGSVSIAAGPCAIEDEELVLGIAAAVRARGATLLRGGAYKPRTSPYSFLGLGEKGLEILARVRAETGIGIVTEVLDPRDVEAVADVADMLQIGARNMTNTPLLKEAARSNTPILLKRGFAATTREWVLAAETCLAEGNDQVVLCERGIRSFDSNTRNVLDLGTIAWLKRTTHLPVIADPSHGAGRADLVRDLARASIAVGADGLLVEVHPDPSRAMSDGDQAISYDVLAAVVRDAHAQAGLSDRELVLPTGLRRSPV